MKKINRLALAFLCLLVSSLSIFADDPAAACGAMGCGLVVWLIMMIVLPRLREHIFRRWVHL